MFQTDGVMRCSVHLNRGNCPTVNSKCACSNGNRMCRPPVVRQCLIVDQDLKNESAIDRVNYIKVNFRGDFRGGGCLLHCVSYRKAVEHFKLTIVFIGKSLFKTKFRLFCSCCYLCIPWSTYIYDAEYDFGPY